MTKTLSGLQSGEFDDIDVFHTITINGEAGANNQVLTSDGDETSWKDVTIANNSVGTNQLADNAVTTDKLADNSLENRHLTDGAVDSLEILDGAVIATKIGAGAVIATKIGAGAVTAGKIGAGAVTAGKIGAGAVTVGKIGAVFRGSRRTTMRSSRPREQRTRQRRKPRRRVGLATDLAAIRVTHLDKIGCIGYLLISPARCCAVA